MSAVTVGPLEQNFLLVAASEELLPNVGAYENTVVVTGEHIDTSSQDLFLRGKGTQVRPTPSPITQQTHNLSKLFPNTHIRSPPSHFTRVHTGG